MISVPSVPATTLARPTQAGRRIGSALAGAVEAWLVAAGVGVVVALAGTDMIEYWRKLGYTEVAPAAGAAAAARGSSPAAGARTGGAVLSPHHRALLRDPFGNSQAMLKTLSL